MAKEIEELSNLNKDSIKNLRMQREEYLSQDKEEKEELIKNLAKQVIPNQIILIIKNIREVAPNLKIFTLESRNQSSLAPFRGGSYLTITVKIENGYYTRNFFLYSTSKDANKGVYEIGVFDNPEDKMSHYIFDEMKIGDIFISSHPINHFGYNMVRDENNVLLIADNNGILPAISMAKAIDDGIDTYDLTIFYLAHKYDEIILERELNDLTTNEHINVNYILSAEQKPGYLNGFIDTNYLRSFMSRPSSIFIAAEEKQLKYFNNVLEELKLPRKYIRYMPVLPEYQSAQDLKFVMTVVINNEKFTADCYSNKTIVTSLEEAGIYIPSSCHDGTCGLCKTELLKGEVKIIKDHRTKAQKEYNIIHPCITYPMSDITIIIR